MVACVRSRVLSSIGGPRLLVGLAVLAAASWSVHSTTSSASASSSAHCGPATARTLAADAVARVYMLADTVYGCSVRGGRTFKLGQHTTCIGTSRADPVTVAGPYAAYGLATCGVDTGFTEVVVRNLADGTRLRAAPATSPPGPESYQSVDSLVLSSDGAVAWIGTGSSIVGKHSLTEVRRADRAGDVLLDSGAAVGTRSLRLRHSRLTWKHGSTTRSATLH